MALLRQNLDRAFAWLATLFFDHGKKTIALFLLVFFGLLIPIKTLRIDTSVESFFFQTDRSLLDYMAFKDQFGRDDYVVIGVESESLFSVNFLNKLKALHEQLEETVPHLYQIDSLLNLRYTRGEENQVVIGELSELWPETEGELSEFRKIVMSNPLYLNSIINAEGTMTAILLESELLSEASRESDDFLSFTSGENEITATNQLTEQERSRFVSAIKQVARDYETDDFRIYISGSPVLAHELRVTIVEENQVFISLAILLLLTFLYILFRRVSGVLLPLMVVITATIVTFSTMSLFRLPLTLVTQILPIFIMVVGVGDTVHILALFFRHFNREGNKRKAIIYALEQTGTAVLMTSITTAAGLLSFSSAEMATIAQLGLTGSMGVLITFVISMVLCPSIISVIPLKPKPPAKSQANLPDTILKGISRISINHPNRVIGIFGILFLVATFGITQLKFAHNDLDAFSPEGRFYKDSKHLDKELKGSVVLEVVLDTGRENGLHHPDFLNRLDTVQKEIETLKQQELFVGKTLSITSIVKETNQALHENREEAYRIPQDRTAVAQELFLFENGGLEDLERVTDTLLSKARLTIKAPFADAWLYVSLIEEVKALLQKNFPEVKISITGLMVLFAQVLKKVITSMAESYLIVFSVMTLLMILLIGKIRIGLIAMIPNIFPIVMILGIMGWLSIPLDFFNITLGSIALGIAVDDTIHFFHHFRKYQEETGNTRKAVMETFLSTGRAMLTTTIVLASGFYIFCLSDMNSMFTYGLLLGSAMLFALIADFLLAPALLILFGRENR